MPKPHAQPTFINGAAAVCALGSDLTAIEANLLNNTTAFTPAHRYARWLAVPCGEAPYDDLDLEKSEGLDTDELIYRMAVNAIAAIDADSHVFERYHPSEVGLFLGTTTMGGHATLQQFAPTTPAATTSAAVSRLMEQNTLTERLQRRFPIHGFTTTFSSACSSGAMAIYQAHLAVQRGIVPACLAGGFDALTPITLLGFNSLQVVAPEACQPFQASRRGITLADGGGLVLIERQPRAGSLGTLLGGAASSEGYHMTHPQPQGEGMLATMQNALRQCHLAASAIHYINAHGTGTLANDHAEGLALAALFGDDVFYHSTKAWHGHTLAGAGALEAILTLRALNNWERWQPLWPSRSHPPARHAPLHGLSNSFGFGGSNVSLILQAGG